MYVTKQEQLERMVGCQAELDAIKEQVERETESQIYREQNDIVEIDRVETVYEIVEE